jgi:hypothetical protein
MTIKLLLHGAVSQNIAIVLLYVNYNESTTVYQKQNHKNINYFDLCTIS